MAGRPPRARTIEEIEAKLEPCALKFLYVPEETARTRFLLAERAKVLDKNPYFFDTITDLPKRGFTEALLEIYLNGDKSEHFQKLQPETQAELLKIETLETTPEYRLRNNLETLAKSTKGEATQATVNKLQNNIYNSIKFINCFYKWVLTEPRNNAPNFCSCYLVPEYPFELKKFLYNHFANKCDDIVFFHNDKLPTSQAELFELIKEYILNDISNIPKAEKKRQYFDIIEQIKKALQAVTLEDISKRPSTSKKEKELSLFTGNFEDVIHGVHSIVVNDIATLSKDDKQKDLNGNISYSNKLSNCVLKSDGIEKLNTVPNHKIMTTVLSIGFSKHGKNFFQSGEIQLPKNEFLFRMGLTPKQAKDPINKRAFCRDLSKQLRELLHFTLEVKNDEAIAGGHILDYCNMLGDIITIRMGKECLNILVKQKKIAYVPNTVHTNRIPDNKRIEYFLLVYLNEIYTNKHIQAREQDTLKISTIFENLENYNVIDTDNRKYREKVIDRFIEALDYLQNVNKSIEYYFTTSSKKDAPPIEGPELEKYKNKANFTTLYLWFNCLPLEQYRDEESAKQTIKEVKAKKEATKARHNRRVDTQLAKLEAQRIFDKQHQQEQEQAEDTTKAPELSDFFKIQ